MQSNNLIFLRHSKLVLPYRDHGEMPFATLADLGTGVMNPPIDQEETTKRLANLSKTISFEDVRAIIASPSQRCQDTARAIAKVSERAGTTPEISTSESLREIEFDLTAMDTDGTIEQTFRDQGIVTINTAVFEGMVCGSCETTEHAYNRISDFFKHLPDDGELRIFLTHDFLMRIIEIYIRRQGAAFRPIEVAELESTNRNSYLCGLATNLDLKDLITIQSA